MDTVTIYSRLPHPLRLDHPDHDLVVVNGTTHERAVGDPERGGEQWERATGVTRHVSASLWTDWKARHAALPALRTELWAEPEGTTEHG